MPRYRRQIAAGTVQHLISRFVHHDFLFDHPGARAEYRRRVPAALRRTDWRALAYALMSSHAHWAMRAGQRPPSSFIKPLHVGFAQWLNRTMNDLGPVFADRHRSIECEADTAATLVAYIHNNPVRAGVVRDPADSPWTSHRAYLGLEPAPPWLDVTLGLHLCGFEATASGRAGFHDFVASQSASPRSIELSGGDLERHRKVARSAAAAPVELATPTLRLADEVPALEAPVLRPPCCPARPIWLDGPLDVIAAVSEATGVSIDALRSRARAREVTSARRLALLAWSVDLSRPGVEMAHALGIGSSAACGLIARASVNDRRRAAQIGEALRRQVSDRQRANA